MTPDPSTADVVRPMRANQPTTDPSWGTDTGAYSPHEFYTTATGDRGDRTSIRVSVPPNVAAEMARLVQQRQIPEYRTTEDIVRDAIAHRLHWVGLLLTDGELMGVVNMEMAHARLHQLETRHAREESYVVTATKLLQQASSNPTELGVVIEEVQTVLDQQEMTPAVRERLNAELRMYRQMY